MKIATWNVNSVRARLSRLLAFLEREQPDVVCLQELKVADEDFPTDDVRAAGYHAAVHGQRTYNGVAILSRAESSAVRVGLDDDAAPPSVPPGDEDSAGLEPDTQARLIAATISDVRVISAYFPNGQSVGSEKWRYKLDWMRRLGRHLASAEAGSERLALCGDFNVAPEDRDVARPEEWAASVLCHQDARLALKDIMAERFIDAMRLHHEGPGPYSWWDYRMLGFPKGNGLRIDHIAVTRPLADRCTKAWVDRNERKGKLPSDHAPVLAEFA